MPALAHAVRLGGLRELVELDLRRLDRARGPQFGDALHGLARARHRRPQAGDVAAVGLRRFGASDNARAWWDNEAAFRYGYRPTGVAETFAAQALKAQQKLSPDPIGDWYQGGPFCSDEYDSGFDPAAT